MEAVRFKNQSGLLNVDKLDKTILVIGAGAIGSFYVTTAAKMGFKRIHVYDSDTIEDHNIANQMFPEHFIGSEKVDALKRVTKDYSGVEITYTNKFWHPDNAKEAEIVVMATDNMDARIAIWNYYSKKESTKLIIDGRMGAQVYRAYCIDNTNKDEKAFYETTLYPQKDAVPERCTMKSIIFTVLGVSSTMLDMTKQWCMNEVRPTAVEYDFVNHRLFSDWIAHKDPMDVEIKEDEPEPAGEAGGRVIQEGTEGGHILPQGNEPLAAGKE
jgi:molybdopterin/thiamine biosynthesis adenylyltransferase